MYVIMDGGQQALQAASLYCVQDQLPAVTAGTARHAGRQDAGAVHRKFQFAPPRIDQCGDFLEEVACGLAVYRFRAQQCHMGKRR